MNYSEYSYRNRNMTFVAQLVDYLVARCNMKGKLVLSIGAEDMAHEKELAKYCEGYVLNDIKEYNAETGEIPFDSDKFDFVFIKSVIEHIRNTNRFLKEIRRVLKPGGKVIVLTPDYEKQKAFFYHDYTHVKPFTLLGLDMALMLNGFKINWCEHFWYYRAIWLGKVPPNHLPVRFAYWLTKVTGVKWFRWGSDRQLFAVGEK